MGKFQAETINSSKAAPIQESDLHTNPLRESPRTQGLGGVANQARAMTTLQRSIGNTRASTMAVQAKLEVNTPGDEYEQEANTVARRVVQRQANSQLCPDCAQKLSRNPNATLCPECEAKLQRQAASAKPQPEVTPDIEQGIETSRGGGQRLPEQVQFSMGQAMGADFGGVRVHADATADSLNRSLEARAFTTGQDIFFKQGEYAPESSQGQELLAHELTHVVQQKDASSIQRDAEEHPHASPSELIESYTSWGNLDEDGLGAKLYFIAWMSPSHYSFVLKVFAELADGDRDDVALAFTETAKDEVLDQFAATPAGQSMLDRIYAELTDGWVGSDEEKLARRILTAKTRAIPVETYLRGAETAMIFPFRKGGFTVIDDSPIMASLRSGKVHVKLPTRVLGTSKFRAETTTLPVDVFIGGIDIPSEQIVGVKLYDEDERIEYLPALSLVGFSGEATTSTIGKIGEAGFYGLTFGTGALVGGGARALTWGARALLWADRAAVAISILHTVVNEHRAWIIQTFPKSGRAFIRAVEVANMAAQIYGIGRLAYEGARGINNLRKAFQAWREERQAARALSGTDEASKVASQIDEQTQQLLQSADEARNAKINDVVESSRNVKGNELTPDQVNAEKLWMRENPSGVRPSSLEGYTHEVSLPNGHTWRRTSKGRWCRFSDPFCDLLSVDDLRIDTLAINTAQIRAQSGVATGGESLPAVTGRWLDSGIGVFPKQIADRMREIHFDNWQDFQRMFWRMVASDDKQLARGWSASNLRLMRQGYAPFVPRGEAVGGGVNAKWQLDHIDPLEHGGGLYDLDNIHIVTPRVHGIVGN
jgi:hypothetical protein